MAEPKNHEEEDAFPSKRKPIAEDEDDVSTKKQKVELCTDDKHMNDEEDEDEDYESEEDDGSDNEEEEEEYSNGKTEIDRKGKGIMKDDKGKGKMIEESEEEDSSDDNGDSGSESEGDGDLSDDPLAEVDLDNILPSRTRRGAARRGVCISNDKDKDSNA